MITSVARVIEENKRILQQSKRIVEDPNLEKDSFGQTGDSSTDGIVVESILALIVSGVILYCFLSNSKKKM